MRFRHFAFVLVTGTWMKVMKLGETKGFPKEQRILPRKNYPYVFKGDTIKVSCRITSDKEILNITWSLFIPLSIDVKSKLSNSSTVSMVNTWNANRTVLLSVLSVTKIPTQHDRFYYSCHEQDNDDTKYILYYYIKESNIPKMFIGESVIAQKNALPNGTIEGVYNSSVEIKCKLTFESHEGLRQEYVKVELRKYDAILLDKPRVKYDKAKGVLLQHSWSSLEAADGGVYTCASRMIIAEKMFVSAQYFELTLPLRLTGDTLKKYSSSPGQDIELVCEIEGFPTPRWSFSHENGEIRNDTYVTVVENRFEIRKVELKDQGLYSCIAEDQAGNVKTQNFSLIVISPNCGHKAFQPLPFFVIGMILLLVLEWW